MPQSTWTSSPGGRVTRRQKRDPATEFDVLLMQARTQTGSDRREDALASCWAARRLAKTKGLERVGEADLAIGLTLLDLHRMNEGLEAVHRAGRYFAQRGALYLRGCAELTLAEAAFLRGEDELAERYLKVATDLLLMGGSPPETLAAFDEHVRRLEHAGKPLGAVRMRLTAEGLASVGAGV